MAAGLPTPKTVFAHGWLLFEQSKMSKSRGNIVRAETVLEVLGADALRYFLLREVVFGQDGSFSFDALVQRYNSDLANGYGNLVSRTLAMITKYFDGVIPQGHDRDRALNSVMTAGVVVKFGQHFDNYEFSLALSTLWEFLANVDAYITESAPWKLGAATDPESRERLADILYNCAAAVRIITALVYPVLPGGSRTRVATTRTGRHSQGRSIEHPMGRAAARYTAGRTRTHFPKGRKGRDSTYAGHRREELRETGRDDRFIGHHAGSTRCKAGRSGGAKAACVKA